jgi:hypothetical protein
MTPNRTVRFFGRDAEGICIAERCRYAPRKFDEQRVFLTWGEIDKLGWEAAKSRPALVLTEPKRKGAKRG